MKTPNLDRRATFAAPAQADDGYGGFTKTWDECFTYWCNVLYLKGGEAVLSARINGQSVAVFTVRKTPETDAIDTDWRATLDGVDFNITEPPRRSQDRRFYEMTAVSGVAI